MVTWLLLRVYWLKVKGVTALRSEPLGDGEQAGYVLWLPALEPLLGSGAHTVLIRCSDPVSHVGGTHSTSTRLLFFCLPY